MINRRKAVQRVALILGGSVIGAEMFVQYGCKQPEKDKTTADTGAKAKPLPDFFTKDEIAYLDEIAETIIPKTDSPGAKEAMVGAFMNVMVRDCYTPDDQKIFKDGLQKIETLSKDKYQKGFMQLDAAQRKELLTALDKEAKAYTETAEYKTQQENLNKQENITDSLEEAKGNFGYSRKYMPKHYFRMMKELTLLGFFTSEPGATKALRYVAVPGKYDPCLPYKKGDKAWATA